MVYPGTPSPGVLWRNRQWRLLLNLIDHLPPNCHSNVALANDEEYAEMVLEQSRRERKVGGEEKKAPAPSAVTWSPEMSAMAVMIDKLSILIETNSSKPKQIVPYPRPKTGFDKIADQLSMASKQATHDYLVSKMIAQ